MSSNISGAVVLALGVWIIFGVALLMPRTPKSEGQIWVVTASENIPSRPTLVRAVYPDTNSPDERPVSMLLTN